MAKRVNVNSTFVPPRGGVPLPSLTPSQRGQQPNRQNSSTPAANPAPPTTNNPQQTHPAPPPRTKPSGVPPQRPPRGPAPNAQQGGQTPIQTNDHPLEVPSIRTNSLHSVEPKLSGPVSSSKLAHQPNEQAAKTIGVIPTPPLRVGKYAPKPKGEKASTLFAGQMQPPRPSHEATTSTPTETPSKPPNKPLPPLPQQNQHTAPLPKPKVRAVPPPVVKEPIQERPPITSPHSEEVNAIQQHRRQHAEQPKQDLQTLLKEVSTGEVGSDFNSIYGRYNKGKNPLHGKSEQDFEKEVLDIKHQSVTPGWFEKDADGSYKGGGYMDFQNTEKSSPKERVYINAKAYYAPQVMQHVVDIMGTKGSGIHSAKIFNPRDITSRNDGIVAYTDSSGSSNKLAASLARYQQQNPLHFGNSTPLMTEPTGVKGVSVGEDPKFTDQAANNLAKALTEPRFKQTMMGYLAEQRESGLPHQPSFGQVRADMISQAVQQDGVKDSQGKIDLGKLQRETNQLLDIAGVDIDNPSKNKA